MKKVPGMAFRDPYEAMLAAEEKKISLHAKIKVRIDKA